MSCFLGSMWSTFIAPVAIPLAILTPKCWTHEYYCDGATKLKGNEYKAERK